jgi:hypothetical protein
LSSIFNCYAECHFAECRPSDCHGAVGFLMPLTQMIHLGLNMS